MIDFNQQERRLLQEIGHTDNGRNLIVLLAKAKDHYSSIQSVDPRGDAGAQVEGRKLFCNFVDEISKVMNTSTRRQNPVERDDFT